MKAVKADNGRLGAKGLFVWTGHKGWGSNLSYSWHPKCCHAHTHKNTRTLMCTHTRMSGSLSQRLWLQLIWESSTSGALTFHCRVKGGGGVCVWIGDRRTRKAREWQKENLHCFDQNAGETATESCSDTRTVHARIQNNIPKSPQMLAIDTHRFSSICAGCKILKTLISIENAHVLTGHASLYSIFNLFFAGPGNSCQRERMIGCKFGCNKV